MNPGHHKATKASTIDARLVNSHLLPLDGMPSISLKLGQQMPHQHRLPPYSGGKYSLNIRTARVHSVVIAPGFGSTKGKVFDKP
ncbi:MAG: hypothetical protein IPO31_27390 [Candidatus Obscuribacter sp.]|nr:hypothetical protein [Candidatus Obscuribacter sp.]